MADTTKDIWNDSDGEEKAPKKKSGLRHFLVFFLVLAVVLAVAVFAAYKDGTGFDALHRYFSYGSPSPAGGRVVYRYDVSPHNRFAILGDHLVVLSDTRLSILDTEGKEVWSATVSMSAPALSQGGGRAVAYDVGGTELYVLDQEGELLHLTASEEEPFIAATLNRSGALAVTAEKENFKGGVTVYDEDLELVFEFKSSERFVTDAYVADDGLRLAAVTLGQESGVFVSNVVIYDLSQIGEIDPVSDYDVRDGLVVAIGQQTGEQTKRLVTVSDTCLTFAGMDGTLAGTYSFGDDFLRGYALEGDGFAALLLNRYQSGSVGRLVTVGADGTELASLDVNQEVLSISAAGRYLAVLYADEVVVYDQNLQTYASLTGTDQARTALMRRDGAVVLLASGSAGLFLP